MANPEHEALINRGYAVWNQWRKDNPEVEPDLLDAKFDGAALRRKNLYYSEYDADPERDEFIAGANLSYVNFTNTNLGVDNR